MKRITNLEPLCALILLRMTHEEFLRVLLPEGHGPTTEPLDSGKAAHEEDDEQDDPPGCDDEDPPGCDDEDPPGCDDAAISLDFARLEAGLLSRADVYRLENHLSTCDTCKEVFAAMVCEERRAKALDNFEGCEDICG